MKLSALSVNTVGITAVVGLVLLSGGGCATKEGQKPEVKTQRPSTIITSTPSRTPSSTSIQSLVTYENKEYGFSVEHPADWTVKQVGPSRGRVDFDFSAPHTTGEAIGLRISVLENVSIDQIIKDLKKQPTTKLTIAPSTTINGLPATVLCTQIGTASKTCAYYIESRSGSNLRTYIIADFTPALELYRTFRLLPTATSTSSTIKAFESKELGFSLQIPADWRIDNKAQDKEKEVLFFYPGTGGEPAVRVQLIAGSRTKVVEGKKNVFNKQGKDTVTKTDITLSGVPATKVCYESTSGNFCEYYIAKNTTTTLYLADYSRENVYKTLKLLK